jgi:hypothetical protein
MTSIIAAIPHRGSKQRVKLQRTICVEGNRFHAPAPGDAEGGADAGTSKRLCPTASTKMQARGATLKTRGIKDRIMHQ